jgi:hypothetical protein
MKKMTIVVATMLLSLAGCQTCNTMTQRLVGHFQGSMGRLGNCGLGNCGLGNCQLGGGNNVGEPCDAGCQEGAAPMTDPCQNCGQTANYGGYGEYSSTSDGVVIGSYEGYPSGATISSPSTIVPSPGSTITTPPSGSYLGSPSSAGSRSESILPKLAN